ASRAPEMARFGVLSIVQRDDFAVAPSQRIRFVHSESGRNAEQDERIEFLALTTGSRVEVGFVGARLLARSQSVRYSSAVKNGRGDGEHVHCGPRKRGNSGSVSRCFSLLAKRRASRMKSKSFLMVVGLTGVSRFVRTRARRSRSVSRNFVVTSATVRSSKCDFSSDHLSR